MGEEDRAHQPDVDSDEALEDFELAVAAELLLDIYLARRAARKQRPARGDNPD
jgi:hypothetical protein